MAESVLSAILPILIEKLDSKTSNNIARYKGIGAEIEKCQDSLKLIQAVLTDAYHKEITSQAVKVWLNDLQHLAYDIDDVLDGWATDAMHREFTHDSEAFTSKVRKLIPSCCTNLSPSNKMHDKLDLINAKLERLVKQRDDFDLKVKGETRPQNNNNRRLQTSVVDPSSIIGREAQKEALVKQLLEDGPSDEKFSIVPIVGMGGVGKTTLARLLYNEKQVENHFQLKAWVCVSDEFDGFGISKVIFQSMAGVNKEFANLNLLQEDLVNHVRGNRFLLVLDDVWSESREDWETLVKPFYTCSPGSKIIITTRKDKLLKKLGYNPLNKQLEKLSYDDALSLFALHALGVRNFESHLSLKPHGEGIVEKCDGLPLALIAVGTSMRTKEDENSWKGVLESEIWKVEGETIPALRLSYRDLSGPLKQLFAYCSLFPKDFLFDKEELVLLWEAEGFLHQPTPSDSTTPNDSTEEQLLGRRFFDELLSKSFFQPAPVNESLFVMHDLMNDLATSVATEFFVRLDIESKKNIRMEMLEKYRHMSFVREKYAAYKKFEAFERGKSLRTFLATSVGEVESWRRFYLSNKILTDLLPKLPLLRVLSLNYFCISEVPESIGSLRHLRYLNLSRSSITHLPETVCNLYNLQTLILFGCAKLAKLPNNFLKLKNLRHLDVRYTTLLFQMLVGIGELKSLQITHLKIIIESESGFEIAKLKDFKNLCTNISIQGLEHVQNAMYAREVNFSQKRIRELELVWSAELNDSRKGMLEKEVLNELKPCHEQLTQLKVRSYGGIEFPKWVGDPSFLHLKHVSVRGCKRCTSLPPLGQLPSLKELFIEGLDGVEDVDFKLPGAGCAFPSLEILSFKDMCGWKKWYAVVLPCLQQLEISMCPNLVELSLEALPLLHILNLSECDSGLLERLVKIASTVTKLEITSISSLNDEAWGAVIEYLDEIEELSIADCNEIRYVVKSDAAASKILVKLRKLEVDYCDDLVSIGEKEEEDNCRSNLLPSLSTLDVYRCENMERCSCPDGVEELSILSCSSMRVISFPKGGQEKLRSLRIFYCSTLLERELGGPKMINRSSFRILECVEIENWPNLKSIIELNCCVHLTILTIVNCESVESFPDNLTSLKHLVIEDCPKLDASLPGWVWPPNLRYLEIGKLKKPCSEWGPQNFPTSLVHLTLDGEDGVSSCSQISHILPSSLTFLSISEFKKLESVSTGLQHLTSLQHLTFYRCPNLKKVCFPHPQHLTSLQHLNFRSCRNMMDLPETLLPSLLSLQIFNCPNLAKRCSKRGRYWPLIYHIPGIHINELF